MKYNIYSVTGGWNRNGYYKHFDKITASYLSIAYSNTVSDLVSLIYIVCVCECV